MSKDQQGKEHDEVEEGSGVELSSSARATLRWIAGLLSARYTGTLTIECREGGVRAANSTVPYVPRGGSMVKRDERWG